MPVKKYGRSNVIVAAAVIAVVAAVSLATYSFLSQGYGTSLRDDVKRLYELANPGITAEVVSIADDSGMYKVGVKLTGTSNSNYGEVWVTKDGRMMTTSVIFVKDSIAQIQKSKDFVDCLDGRGVRIYGVLNQTTSQQGAAATYQQLNTLGLYSAKLYVDCDANLQACLGANVSYVPSVVFDGKVESGLKDIPMLENLTGCKMG